MHVSIWRVDIIQNKSSSPPPKAVCQTARSIPLCRQPRPLTSKRIYIYTGGSNKHLGISSVMSKKRATLVLLRRTNLNGQTATLTCLINICCTFKAVLLPVGENNSMGLAPRGRGGNCRDLHSHIDQKPHGGEAARVPTWTEVA